MLRRDSDPSVADAHAHGAVAALDRERHLTSITIVLDGVFYEVHEDPAERGGIPENHGVAPLEANLHVTLGRHGLPGLARLLEEGPQPHALLLKRVLPHLEFCEREKIGHDLAHPGDLDLEAREDTLVLLGRAGLLDRGLDL